MAKSLTIALLAGAALLGGCTATTRNGPIDVTRFHLGQPITERTTVAIEPNANGTISPEYQLYADAVRIELEKLGYVKGGVDMQSGYIAAVGFSRTSRGAYREPPPVSIGLGGGSYGGGRRGGGVGVGGGVSFGIGGKTRQLYVSELSVQLRRRSDNTTIWEGRAISESAGDQPGETAGRLASALFKGFPGESGVTITVK